MNIDLTSSPPSTVLRKRLFKSLQEPLERVEELLRAELRSETAYVDELLTYVNNLGGKRLRPALLLLSAQAVGSIRRSHIVLAAVVEMIHIATLIHDDILDDADTRRHQVTVHRRWDNQSSVLLGDYLFTHSFYLASTLDTTYACRVIGQATNKVCSGELQQVGDRGNLRLTEEEYFQIIDAKTAALCACATGLGAYYAGADPSTVEEITSFGRELGMAFQIADDVLDLVGDEAETGKSLGSDLDKQKLTLPLIHLMRSVDADGREELSLLANDGARDSGSRERLRGMLDEFGSLDYAHQAALHLAGTAARRLECLPDSEARATLATLTEFVVSRTH